MEAPFHEVKFVGGLLGPFFDLCIFSWDGEDECRVLARDLEHLLDYFEATGRRFRNRIHQSKKSINSRLVFRDMYNGKGV